jgi:ribosomal protein S18 acetylase RimI-like enzyme
MQIRAGHLADLDHLIDLDGTIEASEYLHLERAGGEGLAMSWRLEERPLREKRIDANAVGDDERFVLKQLLTGADDGIVLAAEHDGNVMALAAARAEPQRQTLAVVDVRVDFEYRRQGLGSAMLYQIITHAREAGQRAVTAVTLTNNIVAARFLAKAGFDLGGVDTHFASNHDLVKEAVALFWYAALD